MSNLLNNSTAWFGYNYGASWDYDVSSHWDGSRFAFSSPGYLGSPDDNAFLQKYTGAVAGGDTFSGVATVTGALAGYWLVLVNDTFTTPTWAQQIPAEGLVFSIPAVANAVLALSPDGTYVDRTYGTYGPWTYSVGAAAALAEFWDADTMIGEVEIA